MTARFEERVALVTGATSGIGRATARLLAHEGATVCATGRRAVELENLQREVEGGPGRILPFPGDLLDPQFRTRLVEFVVGQGGGGLDLLVNAGGIIGSGSIETTTLEAFDQMLDINLRSVFHLTQLAVPALKQRKGAIINVSSVTGTRAFPGVLGYCVSKAGVDQLTRCVALELAAHGVRVNAVNPGVVRTNLHRAGGMAESDYEAFLERSRQTHPLGRPGEAQEVAELIAFLGSDAASWITGESIAIDGGRAQTCAR